MEVSNVTQIGVKYDLLKLKLSHFQVLLSVGDKE